VVDVQRTHNKYIVTRESFTELESKYKVVVF